MLMLMYRFLSSFNFIICFVCQSRWISLFHPNTLTIIYDSRNCNLTESHTIPVTHTGVMCFTPYPQTAGIEAIHYSATVSGHMMYACIKIL